MRTPPAEVAVTPELVRRLLRDQHPDLAGLPVAEIAHGWDNSILTLGERMCVRMPRRAAAAQLVVNEQRWLPGIAERVGVPVPTPLRVGRPGQGYPWHWSVNPWFEGRTAAETPVGERSDLVRPLALFLSRLHVPAPEEAPRNPFRGVPLRRRDGKVRERLADSALPRSAELLALWEELVGTPAWTGPALWLHGDLHPANLLVGTEERTRAEDRPTLAAVLDFGDLTSGDPASDLAVAWLAFGPRDRARLRAELDRRAGIDDHTWARARAWAVLYAVLLAGSAEEHPLLGAIGEHTVTQLLDT
ncbi:aminoglycoside phosphotransferase family protein [Nocardiopsis ganjiahuensis]|uniref:aminoglycoside phosphotransferase family protein n=1 Tax=Nocardiopsis ganjiahuensis TaxID=239984 RepID=UPI00034848F4|nr:aminoglycoside phosphotransferase family protein [Nocardiopsis ganjiahuensis]